MNKVYRGRDSLRSRQRIVVSLQLFALTMLQAAPQQDATPRFRAESELVLVDLVATDREGRFVADLRVDEIQVLADGKPRKIQYFRLERGELAGEPAETPAVPDSLPERVRAPGGFIVFLLDLQTMDLNSAERSKEAIREFLRLGMDLEDHAMLVTIRPPLRVDQPFTRDLVKLEQALDRVPFRRQQASLLEFAERVDKIFERFERTGKRDFNRELGVCAVEMIVARKWGIEARFSRFGGA